MVRLYVCTILLLVLVLVAEADPNPPKVPNPKKVKCKDKKNFPDCNQRNDLYCPVACPRNCTVDCVTCNPVCTPPPPPPPKAPKPKKVKCKDKKNFPTCNERNDLYCPVACPRDCTVDCVTCNPVCTPPPPPPPKAPKPKKVKCKDKKNFPTCNERNDLYCPVDCPRDCTVDCVTCNPVCTPPPPPPPKAPKPKKVKCKDKKNFPVCNQRNDLYCPIACPRDCTVDCFTCTPVCTQSPPSPPPPSPPLPPILTPPPQTSGKKARCKNKNFPQCYMTEHTCPNSCQDHCEVDCVTCSPVCDCNKPGAVCQDPRFVGADGLTFYFHGKKDKDFCIVSDSNLHINAHFIGKRNTNMKRDFTWVQSLGILFGTHQLFIGAKKTSTWDDKIDRLALTLDGKSIFIPTNEGANWQPMIGSGVSVARTRDVNSVEIEVEGNFKIKATVVPITEKDSRIHKYGIDYEDCFAHLDLSFKFYSLSGDVNGVLGQTYANNYVSRVKMGVLMSVLGGDREFVSSSLFSTDCSVSRFNGRFNSSDIFEYDNLNCASGMDGQGVVCKR